MRMVTTLIIFTIGTLLIILLASQYVRPINKIVEATVKVSSGQLVPIDKSKLSLSPEIEILVENFNDMVTKLKERIEIEKNWKRWSICIKWGSYPLQ